jgi:tetratricopeptide (TPR) repeat protein
MNSLRQRSVVLLSAFGLLVSSLSTARAESTDELLKQGDICDKKFDAVHALKCYCAVEKLDAGNASLHVRIARQYRHLMSDAAAKEEKLRLGRLALDEAEQAAALGPNDPEAQLATGITYGKMLPFLPTKEQVAATPLIKASADKTLQLDSKNDTAWHILGRWHRVLADISGVKRALAGVVFGNLPKGSNEEAAKCLEKACVLNPNRPMHYIELGRAYAQMGRKDDARRCINKGLAMPNTEKDDEETKEQGRETLKAIR